MDQKRLTHLRQLEAESIHIIREVAAEFSNPVMLYSIGKDSTVPLPWRSAYALFSPYTPRHLNLAILLIPRHDILLLSFRDA